MTTAIEVTKDLDDVGTALEAMNKTQAGIAELQQKYAGVVYNVDTSKGMADARAARAEIRKPRYTLEHQRKDAKKPVLALGRSVDAMAASLNAELMAIEAPIDEQIKAEEKRVDDKNQAIVDAENARRHAIRERIETRYNNVYEIIKSDRDSENITQCIEAYKQSPIDNTYAEFTPDAQQAWDTGLAELEAHLEKVLEREAIDKQTAEDLVELEELRAEKKAGERATATASGSNQHQDVSRDDTLPQTLVEPTPAPMYPGTDAIIAALAEHFDIDAETAQAWLQELREEIREEIEDDDLPF